MSISLEVRLNRFGRIAARLSPVVAEHMDEALDRMEARAKELAPVRTGYLRDHIHQDGNRGSLDRSIVSEAEYSLFVENGTIHMRAEPFLGPAINEAIQGFIDKAIGIDAELVL